MVTFDFAVRDRRVAHFPAILRTLQELAHFTPAQESELIGNIADSGPGLFRAIVRSTPGIFTLELRPVSGIANELIMDAAGTRDQRSRPTQLGPDRGWLSRQLAQARARGAGDCLLLDQFGRVISGLSGPLLLIEGANVHVSDHPLATPCFMLEDVVAHLLAAGLQLIDAPEGFAMSPLRRGEVWVLDPVSGIQQVSGWLEYGSIMEVRPLPQRIPPTHLAVENWRWDNATDFN